MNEDTKREVPVTDLQFALVNNLRAALKRHESTLKWAEGEIDAIRHGIDRHGYSTRGARSLAQHAAELVESQSRIDTLLEMAKLAFTAQGEDVLWDLVHWRVRVRFTDIDAEENA